MTGIAVALFAAAALYTADASLMVAAGDKAAVPLTPDAIAEMPHQSAEVKDESGTLQHYSGVPLIDILREAGLEEPASRNDRFARFVVAEGRDGYRVSLGIAEVDPAISGRTVLVADQQNGKPLLESGG